MTHYHCRHCGRRIVIFEDPFDVKCVVCNAYMRRGKGRRTRPAPGMRVRLYFEETLPDERGELARDVR